MRRGLLARVTAGSVLLAILVGVPFVFLVSAIDGLRDSAEVAARGEAVNAAAQEIERHVVDAQAATRGFVITGDEDFLRPWIEARRAVAPKLRGLKGLLRVPEQRRRVDVIDARAKEYLFEWAAPLVAQARKDRAAAAKAVASGEGNMRVEELRRLFHDFTVAQTTESARRAAVVDDRARRALRLSLGGFAGSILLVLLAGAYLARSVVLPIRRAADSATRLAGGDLRARTTRGGPREVDELAASFNAMADSLEQSRHELENQNTELEAQTIELEHQQVRLTSANEELGRTLLDVSEQKERVEALFRYGEMLSSTIVLEELAESALAGLADLANAEIGALYLEDDQEVGRFRLAASRGLLSDRVSETLRGGEGLPGRALAERRAVVASHGEAGLQLAVFGEEVAVRHELHTPLVRDQDVLGVISLGRAGDRPFSTPELELIAHLVDQTSVALETTLALRRVERLASVNRVVLDSTPVGIQLVDRAGHTVLTNATFDRLASTRATFDGSIYDRLEESAAPLADPEGYVEFMSELEADPERRGMHELTARDGTSSYQLYSAPVLDDSGAATGRIFVLQDVTAEREAERLKIDLMATVSHELRTPLASILGFSELLAERELPAETSRRYVDTIHAEAERLTNLITDFLDLQRIEAGGLRVELEPVDLVQLLRQSVELYSGQSSQHSVRLEAPDDSVVVLAERERIAQVVGNLLSNAIKYSPDGGTIAIQASTRNGTARISVRDEGLGIPTEQQGHIFEKFFRVDTSDTRKIGGTGLGLALSREIVEAHGGRIGFTSAEGGGSTFWFELPAGDEASSRGTVLVIGGDAESASQLETWLRQDGYRIEIATSSEAGLAIAERDLPDLVCLDVALEGTLDGWDVLESLKSRPATSGIPVVLCTAGNSHHRAAALGAADVLQKPFSAEALTSTVERVLPVGGGSVLVVDDDPAVRRLVQETLAREGLRIRNAASGEEGLRALSDEVPDVIILDLMMPGIDGFEVLTELRRRPATRDVPVIVLSGKQLSPSERADLQQRVVALMDKSAYSALELRRFIGVALGQKREARQRLLIRS